MLSTTRPSLASSTPNEGTLNKSAGFVSNSAYPCKDGLSSCICTVKRLPFVGSTSGIDLPIRIQLQQAKVVEIVSNRTPVPEGVSTLRTPVGFPAVPLRYGFREGKHGPPAPMPTSRLISVTGCPAGCEVSGSGITADVPGAATANSRRRTNPTAD